MIDKRSRYRTTPVLTGRDELGNEQPLLELRAISATRAIYYFTPTASDRLDQLAYRFYRDPTQFWRICDASAQLDPIDVLEPGAKLAVPPKR
jgi:hypothetical protein